MRRFLFLSALFVICSAGIWWTVSGSGPGPAGENAGSYSSGVYLADSNAIPRLRRIPGVQVGEAVSRDRVLVRVRRPVSLPRGIEFKPYVVPDVPPEIKDAPARKTLLLNVVLFSQEDKKHIAKVVYAAGGTVIKGAGEEGTTLRVSLPAVSVEKLLHETAVLTVEAYEPPHFLSDRAAAVTGTAPSLVPGFITPQGLSGLGQIVGVADSGLDRGNLDDLHPDFKSTPGKMPKVVMLRSWSGGSTADTSGHGTHVSGIVAGTGAASGGDYRGVAPEASIYFQAITNADGEPDPPADLVSLFKPAYNAGVRVHVDGWGGGSNGYSSASSQIDRFCYYNPDFLPVFGAGNGGPAGKTLTSEANSKNALVVGASENPRPLLGYTDPDAVARISGRGPAGDGRMKPDLVAPGVGVIAPASRSAASNPSGNNTYMRQDGTSMSAAVGGGAAVLLREYLRGKEGYTTPPAALLKALLINGARPLEGSAGGGFGILDFAGTVIALREHTFRFASEEPGAGEGERIGYEVTVRDDDTPLKVTLCWTDPTALAGASPALVNDLDLVVEGPDGSRYLGNDFAKRGLPDRLNNVEQVSIQRPTPGRYKIFVTGVKVSRGTMSDGHIRQPFALVYGQPLKHEVVVTIADNTVKLANGGTIQTPQTAAAVLDGKAITPAQQAIIPGADLYLCPDGNKAYVVSQRQCLSPARFLETESGVVATKETPAIQDGGYLVRTPYVTVQRKNLPAESIPPGVRAVLKINPSTQEAWEAEADWVEKDGFLAILNASRISLIGGESYPLEPGYSIARETDPVGLDALDQVFGPPTVTADIPPGIPLKLHLDPQTQNVLHIAVRQKVISGFVEKVADDKLTLVDGRTYTFFPGARVFRGTTEESPDRLATGEHITGNVLDDRKGLLQVRVDTGIIYGQMLYSGAGGETLNVQDSTGNYRTLLIAPGACFYKGAVNLGSTILGSGQWLRVTMDSQGRVARVDVGEATGQMEGTVQSCQPERGLIVINDDNYRVSAGSIITKDGYPVDLEYIRAGEKVSLTFWKEDGAVPVALAIKSRNTEQAPALEVSPPVSGKPLTGRTGGTQLYLYRTDGRLPVEIGPTGEFSCPIDWTNQEPVRLVAADARTGGVSGLWVEPRSAKVFSDIGGHWAEKEVSALAADGLLAGYPDGSFKPDRIFTRVEFAALLSRFSKESVPAGPVPRDTPLWAREAVQDVVYNRLLPLFPDGSFRPSLPVDRATVAVALDSLLSGSIKPVDTPPYRDWATVPSRAREAVAGLYARGLMRGRSNGLFAPLAPLTRAEAAVVFCRSKNLNPES
ncbi:MAG: S8 family serine peptidase [Bacillota bacterium]